MALHLFEPSYADLHELLDAKADAASFNDETNHVAMVKQSKWGTGEGARAAAAAEEPQGSASGAHFPTGERKESARVNGDLHGQEQEDEKEEDEEEEEEDDVDGDECLASAHERLSVKSNESEHELRVLIAEVLEDESHYITTHEIQLSELDHDADCDVSACASWDGEDEHQVYTFVDYASFEREETIVEEKEEEEEEVEEKEEEGGKAKSKEAASAQLEIRRQSEAESGSTAGRVHVAIRARAVNEPVKEQRTREGAACLIAVPGRLHIGGGRLKGRDAHEHSSGASSAVSELDDADKEVRNLTARAFRSLAYPYPCALSFSTSSESSASERGKSVGRWSALVDLKYGKKARAGEPAGPQQPIREAERAAAAALWTRSGVRAPPVEVFALNGSLVSAGGAASARGDKLEIVLRRERRARPAPDGMEDTHRRAALASSLLKSVLSKKVQFERERRMERGEIHEPEGARMEREAERRREAEERRLSESDISLVCLDELADVVDGSGSSRDSPAEAKKGARGGALPRSQNSAFRSWRDGELGFHVEREGEESESANGKATKMSRLFVPSIQLTGGERGSSSSSSASAARGWGSRAVTSKPPEIKISLRSARGDKSEAPYTVANALAAALRSDPSGRVPHFTVRDVRDNNKGKLQTPIHQVRDVRKLVKSSYHFVSLEGNEGKSWDGEHRNSKQSSLPKSNPASLSPMVIKCQSVNTSSGVKQRGNTESAKQRPAEDTPEPQGSSPQDGVKTEATQAQKTSAQVTSGNMKQEESTGLRIETSTTAKRQDKVSVVGEKVADTKMAALEKLQAAVKTMEQLYVFDKKEWKRKEKSHHILDSHVLSLIAREEHEEAEEEPGDTGTAGMKQDSPLKTPPAGRQLAQAELPLRKERKETFKVFHAPLGREERNGPKTVVHLGGTPGKSNSSISLGQKISAPAAASFVKVPQVHTSSSASLTAKAVSTKSPKLPVSLKITKPKPVMEERERPNGKEAGFTPLQFTSSADSENYLTIPIKPAAKQPASSISDKTAVYTFPASGSKTQAVNPPSQQPHSSDVKQHESHQSPKLSSIVMETRSLDTPTAAIYHHPLPMAMQAATPQVICFSPTVQPSPVPSEPFQHMQRKMLLDPTTGNYYLVDTPVQPATKRLFDPETGQYVDVPMPQQPPMTPMPMPMPMPISPLALSPGTYGNTYMFYPGYMPTTVIPARIQSQLSVQSEVEAGDKGHAGEQGDGAYMEGPYYMPSGKSLQAASGVQPVTVSRAAGSKQPVISITSQQGPRIIAPPSFDGTTMSFVVEHR